MLCILYDFLSALFIRTLFLLYIYPLGIKDMSVGIA